MDDSDPNSNRHLARVRARSVLVSEKFFLNDDSMGNSTKNNIYYY